MPWGLSDAANAVHFYGTFMYQRLLGIPFVYDVLRPLAVGGLDTSRLFIGARATADDVVFDVGCGTGIALEHLGPVRTYLGFDTDTVAVARARERAKARDESITLHDRAMTVQDVLKERPTLALIVGVLHHLDDTSAVALLEALRASPTMRRVYTLDPAFLPGALRNNVMSLLDRGRHVRRPSGYEALAVRAGYRVADHGLLGARDSESVVRYVTQQLVPVDG